MANLIWHHDCKSDVMRVSAANSGVLKTYRLHTDPCLKNCSTLPPFGANLLYHFNTNGCLMTRTGHENSHRCDRSSKLYGTLS